MQGEYSLVFLAYNLRRAMSILGVNGLLDLVKAGFFDIFVLRPRVERLNRSFGLENFGVVWRCGVVQEMRCAV